MMERRKANRALCTVCMGDCCAQGDTDGVTVLMEVSLEPSRARACGHLAAQVANRFLLTHWHGTRSLDDAWASNLEMHVIQGVAKQRTQA